MINKTLNIKLIIFSIGLFLSMFSFSDKASALTYVFDCVGGGQITTNASITPTGPFNSGSPTSFTATVSSVSSNCQSLPVTVTAQNNNGSVITMVNQTLNPGVPIGPFDQNFTSPSSSGTYAVHFITGADETLPIYQNYWYETNIGLIWGICEVRASDWNQNPVWPYFVEAYMTAKRDPDTEANATARGVTKATMTFDVTTDNVNGYVSTMFQADFSPNDLEVSLPIDWGGLNHNGGSYCSQVLFGDGYGDVSITESF